MRKILAFILPIIMVLSLPISLSVRAENTPTIVITSSFAASGDWVTIPVYIKNNPGICAAKMTIKYDTSKLSLVSAEKGDIMRSTMFTKGDIAVMPLTLVFASLANITDDGILFNLNFEVLPTTGKGEYDIMLSLNEDDVYNIDEVNVAFEKQNGKIIVPGDAKTELTSDTNLNYPPANWAADNSVPATLANFTKKNAFNNGLYTDVSSDKWYYSEVSSAYEYGLMLGKGEGKFDSDGGVTVAEGITMAARIAHIYRGGTGVLTSTSATWYDEYVRYAIKKGIMKKGQFDSFTRNITRSEMAALFSKALPNSCFKAINQIETLPDVSPFDESTQHILKLYNAGILTGNDTYGTFYPDSQIKRSEAAAIINRVAVESFRKKITLTDSGKNWFD